MAWNPHPHVQDCRDIANKWNYQQVIIIALSPDSGKIETTTYGKTKELCAWAKTLGGVAYDAVVRKFEETS